MLEAPATLILGGIILVGVIGQLFFNRTHIPESLYLILIGMLLGPILGWLSPSFFRDNTSFFITTALVIVLLDSGLKLDLYKTLKNTWSSIVYTLTVGILTAVLVTFGLHHFFSWPLAHGLFLGIVVSGTTTVTIAHLIEKLTIDQKTVVTDTKTILFIESVISDIFVIGAAAIMLGILGHGELTGQGITIMLFNTFVVGIIAGFILGVIWAFVYAWKLHGNKLSYIFTLGVALCVYAVFEYLGLNGALTVAVFSIVVGNHTVIINVFRVRAKVFEHFDKDVTAMKKTDFEFTFLITTFFFVLLGIIFEVNLLFDPVILSIAGAVILLKLIARYAGCFLLGRVNSSFKNARVAHSTMMSCGLASALVAFLAIEADLGIPNLAETVVLIIIATTVVAIIGTSIQEKLTAKVHTEK